MAILAQDSDDDMKELTDALTDGQRAKLAEFLATQEAEEARDQESWTSLFLCAGIEGLPVETVAKALVRGGVEMDSEKREVLPKGTRVFAYAIEASSTGVERALVRGRGHTGVHGWISTKFLPPPPSAAAARAVLEAVDLDTAVRVVPPFEDLELNERGADDGCRVAYYEARVGRSAAEDKRAPPLVVLAHGAGFNRGTWLPAVRALHRKCWGLGRRFDVVAFDWTAHGRSRPLETATDDDDGPSADRYVWRDVFPKDVASLLAKVGVGRDVYGVGHSMGGAGLVLAEAASPRSFRGLLLVDPIIAEPPPLLDATLETMPNAMIALARRSKFSDCATKADVANYFRSVAFKDWDDAAVEAYVDYGVDDRDGVLTLNCSGVAEASVYLAVPRGLADAFPKLPDLGCPVHVATGSRSAAITHFPHLPDTMEDVLRPVARACAQPLRGALFMPEKIARFHMVSGQGAYLAVLDAGHDIMMEAPADTAELVFASLDELIQRRWG